MNFNPAVIIKTRYPVLFRNLLLLVFVSVCSVPARAQEKPSEFWSHVRFGGGLGVSFGDGFFAGTIAPSALYEFNEKLALGVGAIFSYNRQKGFYKSVITGGSLLTLYHVIPEIQLSAEFEELHVSRTFDAFATEDEAYWYPALFAGVGFRSGFVTFGIRYDLLYDENKSIYANAWMPFVRVYF